MIKKPVSELNFVNSSSPLPTVEVDSNSIENAGFSIHHTALQVLIRLAEQDASLRTTLYLYASTSINFREPGFSEFLLVAGPQKVLLALGASFKQLPEVKSRFSDYVSPASALRTFHVEGGLVWEQEDANTWYSNDQNLVELTEELEDTEEDSQPIEEDDWEIEEPGAEAEAEEETDLIVAAAERKAARYRAARSDARISSIRAAIEEVFGLPAGSVALCGPDRRALRGDARIRTLRKRWEES
ncbi:hypothetical protein [Pseudomonas aeruginosa]|uniref:hypothetical protein n=1 Tax=Pseudomonas aeruginosa TaxID=287 RepID=UPI000B495536|nr:hypothetical protein [Pseudomonas aeruginosa]MCU9105931.1 hypothetical protein [Pseudomonas aeruginosa]MCU9250584.1 hypothetical protein [Pseudomonas aeruginosa]MCU9305872.1 hypothetical protein [Pseudomonas aeruginosa]MCU9511712.1 hypothetical protein [Pseudomonas aeruginosa]OWJ26282.1 hypothetical protein CDC03_18525 [Pseudomonas aeruginosa]